MTPRFLAWATRFVMSVHWDGEDWSFGHSIIGTVLDMLRLSHLRNILERILGRQLDFCGKSLGRLSSQRYNEIQCGSHQQADRRYLKPIPWKC